MLARDSADVAIRMHQRGATITWCSVLPELYPQQPEQHGCVGACQGKYSFTSIFFSLLDLISLCSFCQLQNKSCALLLDEQQMTGCATTSACISFSVSSALFILRAGMCVYICMCVFRDQETSLLLFFGGFFFDAAKTQTDPFAL